MGFIPDNRNGLGESVTVELQTESERQIGVNSNGVQRFVYFSNAPQIIVKTTKNVIGTLADWQTELDKVEQSYSSITDVPTGVFTESLNVGGGWFIIDGDDYYSGSIVVADYSNLQISQPNDEYKILTSESANVSPSGYLPDGRSYYSGSISPIKYNRTSICTLTYANNIRVGENNQGLGFVSSKNISNPRLINDILYVDLSLEISELNASINIFN